MENWSVLGMIGVCLACIFVGVLCGAFGRFMQTPFGGKDNGRKKSDRVGALVVDMRKEGAGEGPGVAVYLQVERDPGLFKDGEMIMLEVIKIGDGYQTVMDADGAVRGSQKLQD